MACLFQFCILSPLLSSRVVSLVIINLNNMHTASPIMILWIWLHRIFYIASLSELWLLFFPLLPLTGNRLGPLLQCHLPDQDRGSPAAVFSEPYYRGAGCAADTGFWGPGSFGHWDLLYFPGGGCRPRGDHAPRAGNCRGPHHGRSPWVFYQQSSFISSFVTYSEYRLTVSNFILVPHNWQALDYNITAVPASVMHQQCNKCFLCETHQPS